MPASDTAPAPVRIGLLLIDGFALMSYATFVEPFRAANLLAAGPLYDWVHVSPAGGEAVASNGARLIADAGIGAIVPCDMLVVFAGGDPRGFDDASCLAWLRAMARRGIPLGGVSGGPYLLARAGLLRGRRATIHWEHATALAEDFPSLRLEPGVFVIDRDRMTCAGGTAGLDLALALIARDHGAGLAGRVGDWFIGGGQRASGDAQRADASARYGAVSRRVASMLSAMDDAIEEPVSRVTLAAGAGVSLRQLERSCQRELGMGIGEAYLAVRLDRARELLRSTDLSITEVAMICGFRSVAHFSRRFKIRHGSSPSVRRSIEKKRLR